MKCLPLPRLKSKRAGFTLIECSLVIGLVGLLLFLTTMHAQFLNRLLVRSELDHLYTTCYYLQKKAMITRKPQKLTFNIEKNSYQYGAEHHELPKHVCFNYPQLAKGPPAHPDHLITKPITFKDNAITFHPTGVVQAGAVYICDMLKQYGYALSCSVAQLSYLRKYQYTDDGWFAI